MKTYLPTLGFVAALLLTSCEPQAERTVEYVQEQPSYDEPDSGVNVWIGPGWYDGNYYHNHDDWHDHHGGGGGHGGHGGGGGHHH